MPLLLLVAAAVTSIAQPATDLFLENRGQFAAPIYFGGRLAGSGDVAFLPNSVDFSWTVRSAQTGELRDHPLRMTFLGSNPLVQPIGIDPTPTVHHFYHGSAAAPIENVRSFAAIRYDRLYHGIDAIYRVDPEQGLKYDLVVAPGAIPQQIVISYDGAEGALSIDASGRLVIPTRFGRLLEAAPYSYQEIDGKRVEIDVRYQLIGSDRFGFAIGTYDPSYPLVIDPCLAIEYLTYLGGGGYDEVTAMATDSAGFGYTVGMTRAINFPGTTPVAGITPANRVFVSKISSDGTTLLYTALFDAEYVGPYGFIDSVGPFYETLGEDIEVTADGRVVFGMTTNQRTMPTTAGAYAGSRASNRVTSQCGPPRLDNFDAFVARLSTAGTVEWGSYLGGGDDDFLRDLAIRPDGSIALTGITAAARCGSRGDSLSFPTTEPSRRFGADALLRRAETFVSVLDASGANLQFSALVGGTGDDIVGALDVDDAGLLYLVGSTGSTDHFTTTNASVSSAQPGLGAGIRDIFLLRVDPSSADVTYAGYVPDNGGNGRRGLGATGLVPITGAGLQGLGREDIEQDIIVESPGRLLIGGSTRSRSLPAAAGIQSTPRNPDGNAALDPDPTVDAFVLRYDMNGAGVVRSTYLGGRDFDGFGGLAYESGGTIAVGVTTASDDFPTTLITIQDELDGDVDAAMVLLGPNLDVLEFGTYVGGPVTGGAVLWEQTVRGVVADRTGGVYLFGGTTNSRLPVSQNALSTFNDFFGGWIVKLAASTTPRLGAPTTASLTPEPCARVQSSGILVFNSGSDPLRIDSLGLAVGAPFLLSNLPDFPIVLGACDTTTLPYSFDVSDTAIRCGSVFRDTLIIYAGNAAIPVVRTPLVGTKACADFLLRDKVVDDPRYRLGSGRGYNLLAFVGGDFVQTLTVEPAPENDGAIRLRDPIDARRIDAGITDIALDVVATDTGRFCATFYVTIEPCSRKDTIRICTSVTSGFFNIMPDTIDLGRIACGITQIPTKIFNTGNDTLEFRLEDLKGPHALDVFYRIPWDSLRKIGPGDTFDFTTFYRPFGVGDRQSEPTFETSDLTRPDHRQVIRASFDTVVIGLTTIARLGAFGETLDYPVAIEFLRNGTVPLRELTLLVDFDRDLLDIAGIDSRGRLLEGWTIEERQVTDQGESLRLVAGEGAPGLNAGGELLALRMLVLRGDSISTPITVALADPSSLCIELDRRAEGGFALSPECLAAERLLLGNGRMLRPVVPNPTASDAIITINLPHAGSVEMTILDATGTVVLQPILGDMNEGYYDVALPSGGLPSGLYYCRLSLDDQLVDTRRFVIVE